MTSARRSAAALVCCALLCGAQPLTTDALRAEIAQLRSSLGESPADVLAGLPERWELNAGGTLYSISTAPLKESLEGKPPKLDEARAWLDQLQRHITSGAAPEANTGAEQKLTAILARDEFRHVRSPSAWDELRARINLWIAQTLSRLFGFLPGNVPGTEIFFWILISAAVGIAGMFLLRYLRSRGDPIGLPAPNVYTHEGRSWKEWLQAAHDAAARDDAKEAIRCGYWAGVSRLQIDRVLPPKVSQTPRELVGHARQSETSRATVDSLTSLTAAFERFWYGRDAAGLDDVRESFHQLETLGCRLD